MSHLTQSLLFFGCLALTVTLIIAAPKLASWQFSLKNRNGGPEEKKPRQMKPQRQIWIFSLILVGLALTILTFPGFWIVKEGTKLEPDGIMNVKTALLGFLGVVVSAALAISSSSILGNAFAGLMIRSSEKYGMGDYIRINEYFGMVRHVGLLQVEILLETRGMVTLPNMYMISYPVERVPSDGRLVSTEVSLGYDVHRSRVMDCLTQAAEKTGLLTPFVSITNLGDYSVVYRVSGILPPDKNDKIFSMRSKLNSFILDILHEHEIEIVSPLFVVERSAGQIKAPFIPKKKAQKPEPQNTQVDVEELLFKEVKDLQSLEELKAHLAKLEDLIKLVSKELNAAEEAQKKRILQARIDNMNTMRQSLTQQIEGLEKDLEE